MVNWSIGGDGEAGTSSDGKSSTSSSAWSPSLVTSQVVGGNIGNRRVVVGVLANVLVNWILGTAVGDLLEDVMSADLAGQC